MVKVLVLVEGQTEEAFVKRLLAAELGRAGVAPIPVVLTTKRLLTGDKIRGGYSPYPRIRAEIRRLLGDSSAAKVTSMLDYYGLPPEFPGREKPEGSTPVEKVEHVEHRWAEEIGDPRFLPYLSLHEFEAMLYTDPDAIASTLGQMDLKARLQEIRRAFPTPEHINDHAETAPSRRLLALFPRYNKPFYGELIVERIGLPGIRRECRHLDRWISSLEALGSS